MVILCWNRDHVETWPRDEYDDTRIQVDRSGPQIGRWSCGNRVNIALGTPCFLLTQGQQYPRGLVGLGFTTSEPYLDDAYDDSDGQMKYVEVQWHKLLPLEDVVPIAVLQRDIPEIKWSGGIRGSGFSITLEFQERLLKLWQNYDGELEERDAGEVEPENFSEGGVRTVTVNRYERDPKARKACLKKFGAVCQVCGLDPVSIYGEEIGSRVIHVHHINPVSQGQGKSLLVDPIKDLVPLCPNCHTAIHKIDPLPTPQEFMRRFRA